MKRILIALLLVTLAACSQVRVSDPVLKTKLSSTAFGTPESDSVEGLAKHSSGVYAVGYTGGNLHATHKGQGDSFIRKYDTSGKVLWGRQFGTPYFDLANSVGLDQSNNAYMAGTIYTNEYPNNADGFLCKYTSDGDVAWTKRVSTGSGDYVNNVAVYRSSIYVLGYTDTREGPSTFIRKYNSSGVIVWTRQFGVPGIYLTSRDMTVDGSGNIYVVGELSQALVNGTDVFVAKLNADGRVLWAQRQDYGEYDGGAAVAVSDKGVYVVGYVSASNIGYQSVVKYTTSGLLIWSKRYGQNEISSFHDASADSSGNLYLAGGKQTNPDGSSNRNYDKLLVKFSLRSVLRHQQAVHQLYTG